MPHAETREYAHELIERIAPSQVPAVVGLLETMLDPVARAVANAPVDEEILTPQAEQALSEAAEWSKRNRGVPHEVVVAELGILQEEIEAYPEPR
jgi:hypothetical protein